MSDFSNAWCTCMHSKSLPVPDLETVEDALDLIHKLHDAWETAGGGEELLIGGLIAAGALVGVDEGVVAVLGEAAQVAVGMYLLACTGCLASAAYDRLVSLNEAGEVPPEVVAMLDEQGVDLNVATA